MCKAKLWHEGLSAALIAAQMMTTRNAIIGKIHRLGLSDKQRTLNITVDSENGRMKPPQEAQMLQAEEESRYHENLLD
jgi:hypothetical protein